MNGKPGKKRAARALRLVALAVLIGLFGTVRSAQSGPLRGETGNYCVHDYQSGASCSANDVRIEELTPIEILEGCGEGTIGEVEVIFEALVSADGSPDRYDIGLFIDLSGTAEGALSGDYCYHDYLDGPLTITPVYGDHNTDTIPDLYNGPWWNGEPSDTTDVCGDIETNSQVFRVLVPLRLPCVDLDGDPLGLADVHVCASWDNNANTTCTGVAGAVPGTGSKCSCATINFDFTPSAVGLAEVTSRDGGEATAPLLIAAGVLLATGSASLVARCRRNARTVGLES
jgi:hypothetical protein